MQQFKVDDDGQIKQITTEAAAYEEFARVNLTTSDITSS